MNLPYMIARIWLPTYDYTYMITYMICFYVWYDHTYDWSHMILPYMIARIWFYRIWLHVYDHAYDLIACIWCCGIWSYVVIIYDYNHIWFIIYDCNHIWFTAYDHMLCSHMISYMIIIYESPLKSYTARPMGWDTVLFYDCQLVNRVFDWILNNSLYR